jgi:hypothetical protein
MSDTSGLIPLRLDSAFGTTRLATTRFTERTVPIDVGASTTKAEISRGGVALPELAVQAELIGSFLENLQIVQTKVVTQTIAPGTSVAVGTSIDVVLTRTADLPVAVIPDVHVAFRADTMAQLHDRFAGSTVVRDILRTKTTAAELTTDDRAALRSELEAQSVVIGSAPGETVDNAFTALQAAFTFQG